MLSGGLAFLALLLLAVGAWEVRRLAGGRSPLVEGLGFLLLGVLAGEHVLGILPGTIVEQLHPVILVGIAWLGLLYGLQVDLKVVRLLKPWHRRVGLLLPLLPAAAAGGVVLATGGGTALAVMMAGVAAVSSPRLLELVLRRRAPADRALVRLLRLVMAFSGIPALLLLAGGAALGGGPAVGGGAAAVLAAAVGVLTGFMLGVLARGERDRVRLMILLLGTVAVAAGAGVAMGQSPLFPAALAGAVVVNRTAFPHRLLRVAHEIEPPLYVALLVLIGAAWTPTRLHLGVLAALTLGRGVGWLAAGGLLRLVAGRHAVSLSRRWSGLGWLPQGPLAVGLALAAVELCGGEPGVLEAAVLGVVVNHLAGRWWAVRVLPRREAA